MKKNIRNLTPRIIVIFYEIVNKKLLKAFRNVFAVYIILIF